jgi:hypothetical protein
VLLYPTPIYLTATFQRFTQFCLSRMYGRHFNYTRTAEVTCYDSSASLTLCRKNKRSKLIFMLCALHTHILDPIVRAGSDDRSHSATVRFVQSKLPCVTNRQEDLQITKSDILRPCKSRFALN